MITIIKPGLLTTIQDGGRWGYQAYGVPVAGAMDRYAYRMANLLAGNSLDAATLEMTMLGAEMRFDINTAVALCGADMGATLNGSPVSNWSAFAVSAGDILSLHYAASGCRAYLAVAGGFAVPKVLGSCSTYNRGRIGGLNGRALQPDDVLKVAAASSQKPIVPVQLPEQWVKRYENSCKVRVLLGPQEDYFTEKGIQTLLQSSYVVSDEADRMGYRLQGAIIEAGKKPDIVSDALCQGAIQVPGHGMPIIMMADRQTTGGYAKIATVISPDLSFLAQTKPGDTICFALSTEQEAVSALRLENQAYENAARWLNLNSTKTDTLMKSYQIKINGVAYAVQMEAIE